MRNNLPRIGHICIIGIIINTNNIIWVLKLNINSHNGKKLNQNKIICHTLNKDIIIMCMLDTNMIKINHVHQIAQETNNFDFIITIINLFNLILRQIRKFVGQAYLWVAIYHTKVIYVIMLLFKFNKGSHHNDLLALHKINLDKDDFDLIIALIIAINTLTVQIDYSYVFLIIIVHELIIMVMDIFRLFLMLFYNDFSIDILQLTLKRNRHITITGIDYVPNVCTMDQFYNVVNKTHNFIIFIAIMNVIDTNEHQIQISIAIHVIIGETSLFIGTHGTFVLMFKVNTHPNTADLFLYCWTMNTMSKLNPIICIINTITIFIVQISHIYIIFFVIATINVISICKLNVKRNMVSTSTYQLLDQSLMRPRMVMLRVDAVNDKVNDRMNRQLKMSNTNHTQSKADFYNREKFYDTELIVHSTFVASVANPKHNCVSFSNIIGNSNTTNTNGNVNIGSSGNDSNINNNGMSIGSIHPSVSFGDKTSFSIFGGFLTMNSEYFHSVYCNAQSNAMCNAAWRRQSDGKLAIHMTDEKDIYKSGMENVLHSCYFKEINFNKMDIIIKTIVDTLVVSMKLQVYDLTNDCLQWIKCKKNVAFNIIAELISMVVQIQTSKNNCNIIDYKLDAIDPITLEIEVYDQLPFVFA